MAKHTNKVIPLFLVTHYYRTPNKLYLLGYILEGQQRGQHFGVEYYETSKEDFINSKSDEADINFNFDNKYFRLTVGYNKDINYFPEDIQSNLILIKDNMANGEFRYSNYMNHVAYIIMTGMIVTGI